MHLNALIPPDLSSGDQGQEDLDPTETSQAYHSHHKDPTVRHPRGQEPLKELVLAHHILLILYLVPVQVCRIVHADSHPIPTVFYHILMTEARYHQVSHRHGLVLILIINQTLSVVVPLQQLLDRHFQ